MNPKTLLLIVAYSAWAIWSAAAKRRRQAAKLARTAAPTESGTTAETPALASAAQPLGPQAKKATSNKTASKKKPSRPAKASVGGQTVYREGKDQAEQDVSNFVLNQGMTAADRVDDAGARAMADLSMGPQLKLDFSQSGLRSFYIMNEVLGPPRAIRRYNPNLRQYFSRPPLRG